MPGNGSKSDTNKKRNNEKMKARSGGPPFRRTNPRKKEQAANAKS